MPARFDSLRGLLSIARVGIAHEFFGHLFEVVTKVPDRCAVLPEPGAPDQRMTSLFSSGSPLRYFAPPAPITMVATLGAAVTGWRTPPARGWLAASAVGLLCNDVLTAYIIRELNIPLFVAGQPITPADRDAKLRSWYRLTTARIALCAAASITAAIAHHRIHESNRGRKP